MCWGGANYLGVWNYYLNMAKVLEQFEPKFRLVFFCPPDLAQDRRAEAERVTGEKTYDLPPRAKWRDLLALAGYWDRDFYRRCLEAKIDVVFEQAKFLGAAFPIPVLAWIGDLQHRHLPHYFSFLHRLTRDVGFQSQLSFRDHVMVSSESARKDIYSFFKTPRAKIHVVPFAVTSSSAVDESQIPVIRDKYGLRGDYLFLPNQFWRHKNHELAFKALNELNKRGRCYTLALSGQTHDYRHAGHMESLLALVERLGVGANLRWLETIPYSDLLHLIAGAKALLNPSLFEGWSTTVEEAKSLGTAMALSSLDVHREQATGRAVFFDPADAGSMADAIEEAIAHHTANMGAARNAYLTDVGRYAHRLSAAITETIRTNRAERTAYR